jgi:aryl-alcohol dehydrogenase-like predicted oxidoreductase
MRYRRLGKTGYEVSEIGHGAWGIGGGQWRGHTDKESREALRASIHAGVNFIDTALAYGEEGHSEKIIGEVLRELEGDRRVYVATKVPPLNRLWPARPGIGIEDVFPYGYITGCTEASLRNLDVETLDLQQLHVWNPDWLDRDEWRRAIEDLKAQGKVRAFGVSINDHQPDSAIGIINTGLIDTVQVIYNIFDQTPEENLFPLCAKNNIGVIARVPFDEGSLTGRITVDSVFDPDEFRAVYFRGDRKKEVEEHVNALVEDMGVHREALPIIALRFILSQPDVSTVIPGMRSVSSVDMNVTAPMLGPLPEAELEIAHRHAWNKNYYS